MGSFRGFFLFLSVCRLQREVFGDFFNSLIYVCRIQWEVFGDFFNSFGSVGANGKFSRTVFIPSCKLRIRIRIFTADDRYTYKQ